MPLNAATKAARFSIAPMMDWTDRHDRYFLRLITQHALLYTEMVTTGAILHGDVNYLLGHDSTERPLALQLGGSEPRALAHCAAIAEELGYDEINLNVGCPSDRVQAGRFGVCLLAEPNLVAACVAAMRKAVSLPITVKTRIGVDHCDTYEDLAQFVQRVAEAGCRTFIIHARKAWLHGLSPKQNREIPPLRYDVVYRLKEDFPQLEIVINGGITDLQQAQSHLDRVDGVMIGRAAYQNPYLLAAVDGRWFGATTPPLSRHEVVTALLPYVERQLAQGVFLSAITRHLLGLFQGVPGARAWRRYLSENAYRPGAGVAVIEEALRCVPLASCQSEVPK